MNVDPYAHLLEHQRRVERIVARPNHAAPRAPRPSVRAVIRGLTRRRVGTTRASGGQPVTP